jgi:hypothetical protein
MKLKSTKILALICGGILILIFAAVFIMTALSNYF